jgi:hypothetical protein
MGTDGGNPARSTITQNVDEISRPPANLCPFSGRAEFARFRDYLREAIGEQIEATASGTNRQRPPKHLQCMLSSL